MIIVTYLVANNSWCAVSLVTFSYSQKPYNIKGKTGTTNAVDSTAVLLSVMIRQTISGFEGQYIYHLSGKWRTVGEIVEQLENSFAKYH